MKRIYGLTLLLLLTPLVAAEQKQETMYVTDEDGILYRLVLEEGEVVESVQAYSESSSSERASRTVLRSNEGRRMYTVTRQGKRLLVRDRAKKRVATIERGVGDRLIIRGER